MRIFCKQGLILSVVILSTAILVGCSAKDKKTPKSVADKSGEVVGEVEVIQFVPGQTPAKDTASDKTQTSQKKTDGQTSELKSDQPGTRSATPDQPPAENTESQTQSAVTWDADAPCESESTFGHRRFRGWGCGYTACAPVCMAACGPCESACGPCAPACGPACGPSCGPTCAPACGPCAPVCGPVCGPCVRPWGLFRRCALPCGPICNPCCDPCACGPACAPSCGSGCDSTGCCDGMDNDDMDDEPVVEEVMIEAIPAPSANAQGNAPAANTPSSKAPAAKNPAKKTNTNASEKPIEKLPTVTDQSSITPLNNSNSGLRSARPIQAIGSDASKSVDNAVEELPEDGAPKAVENTNQMNQTNQTIQNDSENQTRNMSEDNTLKTDQTPVPATH